MPLDYRRPKSGRNYVGHSEVSQLSPGWAEAFAVFFEILIAGKQPFMLVLQIVQTPDKVKIVPAGDRDNGDWRTAA